MNIGDLIVILIVAAFAGLAVWLTVRRKRKGSSCCGGCSRGSCDKCGK